MKKILAVAIFFLVCWVNGKEVIGVYDDSQTVIADGAYSRLSVLRNKVNETQSPTAPPAANDWTEPFPPFKIAGNLYYVGSRGLANYLITTPQGHILINSDLEENVPLIRASVE